MVNIDTVYQRVLVLANKEQRGYITPLEFNLYANQTQMDIFEQYFYDINQFGRIPGNDTEYSDMLNYLEEKINIFEEVKQVNINSTQEFYNVGASIGDDLYKLGAILYNFLGSKKICEKVNANLIDSIIGSPLLAPNANRPIYTLRDNKVYIYPKLSITNPITVNYIRKPLPVEWAYQDVVGAALYDESESQNFELHNSEETELVIKILQLAGVTLKDNNLYQIAGAEDLKNNQQEKM